MKPIQFLGNSLKALRDFPEGAKQDAGYQLDKVQRGIDIAKERFTQLTKGQK